ncbi:MAG: DUF4956 domain-containing protein [Chitinophagales bacterium]|nr:DUF4956 domain-containing protein [Chitinophagales bacterium]MDW8273918.1 DUF4956 domain-containing protein [Chitinophagales bacterium]
MDEIILESIVGAESGYSFRNFLLRLLLDIAFLTAIVRLIYYPNYRNKDFFFTFYLFNLTNFLICFLLSSAVLKIGFAFGLFAIFSMLRFQTVRITVREMSYIFLSVTLGMINALASLKTGLPALLVANVLLLVAVYVLENKLKISHENFKEVTYEKIDLIKPEKREELLADLRQRTGLSITRVEIISIDFLRDTANLNIFYHSSENEASSRGLGSKD